MANRKNSISDNEMKNAAGGGVVPVYDGSTGMGNYTVYDNDRHETVKVIEGGITQANLDKANLYDEAYHEGKRIGLAEGINDGFNQAKALNQQQ